MIDVRRRVALPADRVWHLLTDTTAWPVWGPTVGAVDADDRVIRAGSTGRVRTVAGVWIPFEVTEFEAGSSWSWRVAGIPATGHAVEADGPDASVVTFAVPLWAAPYAAVCWFAAGKLAEADRLVA